MPSSKNVDANLQASISIGNVTLNVDGSKAGSQTITKGDGSTQTTFNVTNNITNNNTAPQADQFPMMELAAAVNSAAEAMRGGLQELVSMTRGEISQLAAFKEWQNSYDKNINKEGFNRKSAPSQRVIDNAVAAVQHRGNFSEFIAQRMTDIANSGRGALLTTEGQWTKHATDLMESALRAQKEPSLGGFLHTASRVMSSLDHRKQWYNSRIDPKGEPGKLAPDGGGEETQAEQKQKKASRKAQQKQEKLDEKTGQQLDKIQKQSEKTAERKAAGEVEAAQEKADAQEAGANKVARSRKKATKSVKEASEAEAKEAAAEADEQARAAKESEAQRGSGTQKAGKKSKASKGTKSTKEEQKSNAAETEAQKEIDKAEKQKEASEKKVAAAQQRGAQDDAKIEAERAKQTEYQEQKAAAGKQKAAAAAKKASKADIKAREDQVKKDVAAQREAAKNAAEQAQGDARYDGMKYDDFMKTMIDGSRVFDDAALKSSLKQKTGKEPSQKEVIEAKNYLKQQSRNAARQAAQPATKTPTPAIQEPEIKGGAAQPAQESQPAQEGKAAGGKTQAKASGKTSQKSKAQAGAKATGKKTAQESADKKAQAEQGKAAEKQAKKDEKAAERAEKAAEKQTEAAEKQQKKAEKASAKATKADQQQADTLKKASEAQATSSKKQSKSEAAAAAAEKKQAEIEALIQKYYSSGPKGQRSAMNKLTHRGFDGAKILEEQAKQQEAAAAEAEKQKASKGTKSTKKSGAQKKGAEQKTEAQEKQEAKAAQPAKQEKAGKNTSGGGDEAQAKTSEEKKKAAAESRAQKEAERIAKKWDKGEYSEKGKAYNLDKLKELGVDTEKFLKEREAAAKQAAQVAGKAEKAASQQEKKSAAKSASTAKKKAVEQAKQEAETKQEVQQAAETKQKKAAEKKTGGSKAKTEEQAKQEQESKKASSAKTKAQTSEANKKAAAESRAQREAERIAAKWDRGEYGEKGKASNLEKLKGLGIDTEKFLKEREAAAKKAEKAAGEADKTAAQQEKKSAAKSASDTKKKAVEQAKQEAEAKQDAQQAAEAQQKKAATKSASTTKKKAVEQAKQEEAAKEDAQQAAEAQQKKAATKSARTAKKKAEDQAKKEEEAKQEAEQAAEDAQKKTAAKKTRSSKKKTEEQAKQAEEDKQEAKQEAEEKFEEPKSRKAPESGSDQQGAPAGYQPFNPTSPATPYFPFAPVPGNGGPTPLVPFGPYPPPSSGGYTPPPGYTPPSGGVAPTNPNETNQYFHSLAELTEYLDNHDLSGLSQQITEDLDSINSRSQLIQGHFTNGTLTGVGIMAAHKDFGNIRTARMDYKVGTDKDGNTIYSGKVNTSVNRKRLEDEAAQAMKVPGAEHMTAEVNTLTQALEELRHAPGPTEAEKAIQNTLDATKALNDATTDYNKRVADTTKAQASAEKNGYFGAVNQQLKDQMTQAAAAFAADGSVANLQAFEKAVKDVQFGEMAAELKDYNDQVERLRNPTGEAGRDDSANWATAQKEQLQNLLQTRDEINKALAAGDQQAATAGLKEMNAGVTELQKNLETMQKLKDEVAKIQNDKNFAGLGGQLKDKLTNVMDELNNASADQFVSKLSAARAVIGEVNNAMTELGKNDAMRLQQEQLNSLTSKLNTMASTKNGGFANWTQAQQQQFQALQLTWAQMAQMSGTTVGVGMQLPGGGTMDATMFAQFQSMDPFGSFASGSKVANQQMQQLNNSFRMTTPNAVGLKTTVDALSRQLMNLATPMMMWRRFSGYMKQAASNVAAIDSQMADLRKVTNNTDAEYQQFLTSSGRNAVAIGAKISDLVATTSTFAHMGYSLTNSQALGVTATKFANVGNFQNTTEAADAMIAVIKGFDELNIGDADLVGDKLTAVANKYAVTANDISEGLSKSASSLNVAGNNVDQATAMITAIAEVTRDAGAAGSALKVLSMRIRGAKTE